MRELKAKNYRYNRTKLGPSFVVRMRSEIDLLPKSKRGKLPRRLRHDASKISEFDLPEAYLATSNLMGMTNAQARNSFAQLALLSEEDELLETIKLCRDRIKNWFECIEMTEVEVKTANQKLAQMRCDQAVTA